MITKQADYPVDNTNMSLSFSNAYFQRYKNIERSTTHRGGSLGGDGDDKEYISTFVHYLDKLVLSVK